MARMLPPGPRSGMLRLMQAVVTGEKFDALAFSRFVSDNYGGMSYIKFGPITFYQISDPEIVHDLLVKQAANFHKAQIVRDVFKPFVGNGLIISEGDFWKRQRKLVQPAFHSKRIESYGQAMVEHTQKMLDGWRDGESRFIDREMMKLTLSIVCKTLFDADVSGEAERVGELLTQTLDASNERINAVVRLPEWVVTPRRAEQKRMVAELDTILQRFIDERRASGDDRGDLLSMLLMAVDSDDNSQMTDMQLRDEAMTLFIAGHETTAMSLAWAWYLLSQNPECMRKLREEVDTVLNGRAPTLEDLPNLPYGEQVIKETMRLYPAAPGVGREPIEETTIAGYPVPKGALVNVSIYAMHHSDRYFEKPERFNPERFSPENEKLIPRYAYLPFGAGPRVCVGFQFAMMEARLILATIAQRFDLALVPNQEVIPEQLVTLRPKHGIQMRLKVREATPALA